MSKEELDQDVGLNLLQLLGGRKLGERFAAAQPDSFEGEGGSPLAGEPMRGEGA